uniref:Uncharacterized protein n=1 Tax=Cyanothece sp. (strain PCC 7425 / ATCC 29141) TaxID=395961 RepID=B8HZP3_CYAP4
MIKYGQYGLAVTAYFGLSYVLFLSTSNTIVGGIVYLFLLLPFYATVLLILWIIVLQNRNKKVQIKKWIWGCVLLLQIITILVSPGNCFQAKEGSPCYSNLQILIGNAPRTGPGKVSHWTFVENAFPGLVFAYSVAVALALFPMKNLSIKNTLN